MLITIVASNNKSGLAKDAIILTELARQHFYQVDVRFVSTEYIPLSEDSTLSIFLEVYDSRYLSQKNILIPNQEWYFIEWLQEINKLDAIFCKTIYSYNIFKKYHTNVVFTGFTSLDFYEETDKTLACFHTSGKSKAKGTSLIIEAWKSKRLPELHLVSSIFRPINKNNLIHHYNFLDIAHYKKLMNRCILHICPSQAEGFGHCLNEAKSCASVVITTNYPPMNELVDQFLISPDQVFKIPDRLGEIVNIRPEEIEKTVRMALDSNELIEIGKANRKSYLANDSFFKEQFIYYLNKL